jgi:hypothetical protein
MRSFISQQTLVRAQLGPGALLLEGSWGSSGWGGVGAFPLAHPHGVWDLKETILQTFRLGGGEVEFRGRLTDTHTLML